MHKSADIYKLLRVLFWLFYAGTVILWFKNSFSQLKSFPISYAVPLVGLIVTSLIKIIIDIRRKKPRVRHKDSKSIFFLVLLIVLAVAVRIPFLVHNAGLTHSDDAITSLMSKHITEGKLPPLYFYGQLYQGSLFSHFSALMILIFGFSHLLMELIILAFFLAFIVVQFYFLKNLFSLTFAVMASIFYCLPIGFMGIWGCFLIANAYSMVLFLGSLIFYLSYLVSFKNKTDLLPGLGFLIGVAFWAHQISIFFIFAALVILAFKASTLWKKYLSLIFYIIMGCLPLLMAEVFWNFPLLKYLIPGGGDAPGGIRIKKTIELSLQLFSKSPNSLSYVYFFLLLLGFFALFYPSIKAKKFHPQSLYSLFFLLFAVIYLISRFSQMYLVRYLFPLSFCLPILILGVFWIIRSKFKYYPMGLALLLLFFGLNLKGVQEDLQTVKKDHRLRSQTLEAMKKTGNRYWRGNFWTAYLFTALSGEELIADSYSVNRYFPYRLMYENAGTGENYAFIIDGERNEKRLGLRFTRLLEACNLDYQKKDLGGYWLIYDIKTPISPAALIAPVPAGFPDLGISQINYQKGFLDVNFINVGEKKGSDYWIHAEIPGYSSFTKKFPLVKGQAKIQLPYPQEKSFPLEFYLNYRGVKIAQTQKRIKCSPPAKVQERKEGIVFLTGVNSKVKIKDKNMHVCAKQVKIEINRREKSISKIKLYLHSPFEFSHPWWYGNYCQEVEIDLNGQSVRKTCLNDGFNTISIPFDDLHALKNTNILSLQFKYHLFFNFAPYGKSAALLEKIELER